jgi:hypothetical protein
MLPFVLHPLHEILEAELTADIGKEGVVLAYIGVIEKASKPQALAWG